MDGLEKSFSGMDLFTVDDLGALITSMKMAKKESMSMSDIASHLANLKLERSTRTKVNEDTESISSSVFQQQFEKNLTSDLNNNPKDAPNDVPKDIQSKSRGRTPPNAVRTHLLNPIDSDSKRIRKEGPFRSDPLNDPFNAVNVDFLFSGIGDGSSDGVDDSFNPILSSDGAVQMSGMEESNNPIEPVSNIDTEETDEHTRKSSKLRRSPPKTSPDNLYSRSFSAGKMNDNIDADLSDSSNDSKAASNSPKSASNPLKSAPKSPRQQVYEATIDEDENYNNSNINNEINNEINNDINNGFINAFANTKTAAKPLRSMQGLPELYPPQLYRSNSNRTINDPSNVQHSINNEDNYNNNNDNTENIGNNENKKERHFPFSSKIPVSGSRSDPVDLSGFEEEGEKGDVDGGRDAPPAWWGNNISGNNNGNNGNRMNSIGQNVQNNLGKNEYNKHPRTNNENNSEENNSNNSGTNHDFSFIASVGDLESDDDDLHSGVSGSDSGSESDLNFGFLYSVDSDDMMTMTDNVLAKEKLASGFNGDGNEGGMGGGKDGGGMRGNGYGEGMMFERENARKEKQVIDLTDDNDIDKIPKSTTHTRNKNNNNNKNGMKNENENSWDPFGDSFEKTIRESERLLNEEDNEVEEGDDLVSDSDSELELEVIDGPEGKEGGNLEDLGGPYMRAEGSAKSSSGGKGRGKERGKRNSPVRELFPVSAHDQRKNKSRGDIEDYDDEDEEDDYSDNNNGNNSNNGVSVPIRNYPFSTLPPQSLPSDPTSTVPAKRFSAYTAFKSLDLRNKKNAEKDGKDGRDVDVIDMTTPPIPLAPSAQAASATPFPPPPPAPSSSSSFSVPPTAPSSSSSSSASSTPMEEANTPPIPPATVQARTDPILTGGTQPSRTEPTQPVRTDQARTEKMHVRAAESVSMEVDPPVNEGPHDKNLDPNSMKKRPLTRTENSTSFFKNISNYMSKGRITVEKPAEKSAEKPVEKTAAKPVEKAPENTREQIAEKITERMESGSVRRNSLDGDRDKNKNVAAPPATDRNTFNNMKSSLHTDNTTTMQIDDESILRSLKQKNIPQPNQAGNVPQVNDLSSEKNEKSLSPSLKSKDKDRREKINIIKKDEEKINSDKILSLAESCRKEGADFYSREEYPRALLAFEKGLKIAPSGWGNRATVLGNRAATLVMLGRFVEAADDCATALSLDASLIKLHLRRGRALLRLGHLTQASESYTKASEIIYTKQLNTTEKEVLTVRADGKNGLKTVASARSAIRRLGQLESGGDYHGALGLLEDLGQSCPCCLLVLTSKCRTLCHLERWGEAKECAEAFVCNAHISILKLAAHSNALLPAPSVDRLSWIEKQGKNIVIIDTEAVIQAILAMGPGLSETYLLALKNLDLNRNCSADIMTRIQLILDELSKYLRASMNCQIETAAVGSVIDLGAWEWVENERKRTKQLIGLKNQGDRQFRSTAHNDAIASYTGALNVDITAVKWGAILYNNRAAAYHCIGNLKESVSDCHHAIERDPNYYKAYLRRARALRESNYFAASIRDYRHYLSSDPPPPDSSIVRSELDRVIAANKAKQKNDEIRHTKDGRSDEQKRSSEVPDRTGLYGNLGGGAPGVRGWDSGYQYKTNNEEFSYNNTDRTRAFNTKQFNGFGNPGDNGFKYRKNPFEEPGRSHTEESSSSSSSGHNSSNNNNNNNDNNNGFNNNNNNNGNKGGSSSSNNGFHSHGFNSNINNNNNNTSRPSSNPSTNNNSNNNNSNTSSNNNNNSSSKTGPSLVRNKGKGCHYGTLGIDYVSSDKQIKASYHKLALKYHPDKNKAVGAEEQFKIITHAYSVLIDKESRMAYNREMGYVDLSAF